MRPLIETGHLYIAMPPLYKIECGKEGEYAWTEEDRRVLLEKYKGKSTKTQRYKGLGEMDATQLWETTMDPKTRTLIQVSKTEDVASAYASTYPIALVLIVLACQLMIKLL